MTRIALLLVGPRFSKGISGADAHIPKDRFPDECVVDYDAAKNYKKVVASHGKSFSNIYIQGDSFECCPVGTRHLTPPKYSDNNFHIGREGHLLGKNNSWRYLLNMISGLRNVTEEYVVVQRSDQFVNFNVKSISALNPDLIYVPRVKNSYLEVNDFYFYARRSVLLKRFEEILRKMPGDLNIHRALWQVKQSNWESFFSRVIPHPYNIFSCQSHFACRRLADVQPLDFATYSSVVWRGQRLSDEHLREVKATHFFSDDQAPVTNLFPSVRSILKDGYTLFKGLIKLAKGKKVGCE